MNENEVVWNVMKDIFSKMDNEEMTVNSVGGRQHKVEHRCEALFPYAILEIAKLRAEGYEKHGYEDDNYLLIPVITHVGRALRHILLWMCGNKEDGDPINHLIHAGCRILMAIEELVIEKELKKEELERQAYAEAFGFYEQFDNDTGENGDRDHGSDRSGHCSGVCDHHCKGHKVLEEEMKFPCKESREALKEIERKHPERIRRARRAARRRPGTGRAV